MLDKRQHAALFEAVSARATERRALQLAGFDRRPGSRQLHAACEMIAGQLDKCGAHEIAFSSFSFGPNKRYFDWTAQRQPFAEAAELWLVHSSGQEELVCRTTDDASCLIGALRSTPSEGEIFDLVDVGAGTRVVDYRHQRIAGKIALAWGDRPRAALLEALSVRKAAGIVLSARHLEGGATLELDPPAVYEKHRPFAFRINDSWLERLQGLLAGGHELKLRVKLTMTVGEAEHPVVSATLHGREIDPNEAVLLEVAYGQHESASQVAVAIEALHAISQCVAQEKLQPAPRAIRLLLVPDMRATVAWLAQQKDGLPARAVVHLGCARDTQNIEILAPPERAACFAVDHLAALLTQLPGLAPTCSLPYDQQSPLLPYVAGPRHVATVGLGLCPGLEGTKLARQIGGLASCLAELVSLSSDDVAGLLGSATIRATARLTGRAADLQRRSRAALSDVETRSRAARHYLWLVDRELDQRLADEQATLDSALDFVGASGIAALPLVEAKADLDRLKLALSRTLREELIAVAPKKSAHTPKRDRKTPIQRRAEKVVVEKRYEGPFPLPALRSDLKESDRSWFAHHQPELAAQPVGDVLMQWIDGKRTLAVISDRLSLDHPEADLRIIWRYLEALEAAGLVALVESKDED